MPRAVEAAQFLKAQMQQLAGVRIPMHVESH
jgi:hypothetical protein